MMFIDSDEVIGRSLRLYGEWAEHEISLLSRYLTGKSTVVDIGANVGTHTLAFASRVTEGRVIAIEAQKEVAGILIVNCAINRRANVEVVNCICSNYTGWTEANVDYENCNNIGAISFAQQEETLLERVMRRSATRKPRGTGATPIRKLDDVIDSEDITLMKFDIEGMELKALKGASRLIRRCAPVIYMEQLETSTIKPLYNYLTNLGYVLYWLETQPFNQNNFFGATDNIWWKTEVGILALPRSASEPPDLQRVSEYDDRLPCSLDARTGIAIA